MLERGKAMDIAVTMVEHHVWLVGELIDRADGLDDRTLDHSVGLSVEGFDEAPALESLVSSIRSLLNIMVGQMEMWPAVVEGKQSPEIPPQSLAELRQRYGEAGRRFVDLARWVVREGRAEEVFREGTADHPDVFTYGGMIAHVLTFAAHWRALTIGAMQAAGVEDLRYGDPMLFFADRAAR
jgi:AraC family transcriptional regulator